VLKLELDVTLHDAIITAVNAAVQKFHRIDVFVNNAGYGLVGDTESTSESDARLQLETNFWGPVHITKEALRVFREVNPQGEGGTVIQVTSMGGWWTAPGHSFYHARQVSDHPLVSVMADLSNTALANSH
jgi:NAD(P)-dependent dehydrogenase (short-subunit alcohol dehydrogenase family)